MVQNAKTLPSGRPATETQAFQNTIVAKARTARVRMVMAFARLLRVPVDVHCTFFSFGKKDSRTATSSTAPK